jgi:hypothetical protein
MSSILTCFLILAFAWPTSSPDTPSAAEVLRRALERVKAEEKRDPLRHYAWMQRTEQKKFNRDGELEERSERKFIAILLDGERYLRLVEKNGSPLSADEQEKEAQREKKFRERIAKKRAGKAPDDDDDVELNEELVRRYQFQVVGQEQTAGRSAYVLSFLPKNGIELPHKRRVDRILNRLEGKVWIDSNSYSLLKVDMHLTEPTTLLAGLGSVRALDFVMQTAEIAPDVFAPKTVQIAFEGRRLFSNMHVKQTVLFEDYRRSTQVEAKKEKP